MTPKEFKEATDTVGTLFTPLSENARDLLFEEFRNVPGGVFLKALQLLLRSHPYTRFPIPKEIWKAINAIARVGPTPFGDPATYYCEKCGGTGWLIVDRPDPDRPTIPHTVATYCDCRKGQAMRAAQFSKSSKRRFIPALSYPGAAGEEEEAIFPVEWEPDRQPGEEG